MKAYRLSIIFLALILASSCGNSGNQIDPNDVIHNPNTANGTVNTDDLPVFKFDEEEYNFGRIGQGEVVTHVFKFTNVGKSDLLISGAKATCGCTVADYPKNVIKPGQGESIAIKFDSEGKKGMQTKTVTLTANTQPSTKVITIKAEVILPEE